MLKLWPAGWLFVSIYLFSFGQSWAENMRPKEFLTLDEVAAGSLLLKVEAGSEEHLRAPLLSSNYEIDISGVIARTTLTQRFINPSDYWLEGIYAFPIQHTAAIDGLRLRIGDRFIEGVVKENKQAQEAFDTAKKEGKKAALLVQHRPNLFTNTVANIGPGEYVIVQITYQQIIKQDQGRYTLRLPLVVAPRYEAEPILKPMISGDDGWQELKTEPVGHLTNATIRDPWTIKPQQIHNPIDIRIRLNAGFRLGDINSSSHRVDITRKNDQNAQINLFGAVPADQDFVVNWTQKGSAITQPSLFKETLVGETYYLLMLAPPTLEDAPMAPPRNVIFVQDVSGSMSGDSIEQARAGLKIALRRLLPKDKFNIYFFNDELRALDGGFLSATSRNIAIALNAADDMEADGGTEMLPALKVALRLADREKQGRLTQIVFLTDGAISDEARMLRAIHSGIGSSRLFTIGIGSAPNDYFMHAAADMGRGSSIFISDLGTISEQMARLFTKLETPVLTDLEVKLPDGSRELTPNPLPDLYAGEPLIAAFIIDKGSTGNAQIIGRLESKHVGLNLDLETAIERPGIAKLWARRQIKGLERLRNSSISDTGDDAELDAAILRIALRHHLISSRTSLVAVDVTPTRNPEQALHTRQISVNLPKGWDPMAWFLPQDASEQLYKASLSPEAEKRLLTLVNNRSEAPSVRLPSTALNWLLPVLVGLFLLLASIVLIAWKMWEERVCIRRAHT
jgi:Ca-activated chloride channel family protein